MGFWQDLSPLFKKHSLEFIERRTEIGNLVSFIFKSDNKLNWKPGQHGIFKIQHLSINKPSRTFSIASTPDEENILITMRVSSEPSEFKRTLTELNKGDKIYMRGPIGPFHIEKTKPILMIAAGIGITPFRSLIKAALNKNNDTKPETIKLLYLDSNQEYVYSKEFNELKELGLLEVIYLSTRDQLYDEVTKYIEDIGNSADYYVAGPRSMVASIKSKLKEEGILKSSIKSDLFIGY